MACNMFLMVLRRQVQTPGSCVQAMGACYHMFYLVESELFFHSRIDPNGIAKQRSKMIQDDPRI